MAAPSETYVDPSIAANSGTGTIGDPYGDLQYALDTMTRDATNGDRINIKSGTAEVLTGTLDFTSYGGTSRTARLTLEGYDSTAGDGGIGEINGNNGNFSITPTGNTNHAYKNLRCFNTGTAVVMNLDNYGSMENCEVSQSTGGGVLGQRTANVKNIDRCYFYDIAGHAVENVGRVANSYFCNGTTNKFTQCFKDTSTSNCQVVTNCFFNLDSTSTAIDSFGLFAVNNSILGGNGSGSGIDATHSMLIHNNIIEDFNLGIVINALDAALVTHNAFFSNTTNISYGSGADLISGTDNESLSSSPFAKTGSLPTDFTSASFWSDLYAYFAPVDTGNVYSGYPVGTNIAKGAVQPSRINASPKHPLGRF